METFLEVKQHNGMFTSKIFLASSPRFGRSCITLAKHISRADSVKKVQVAMQFCTMKQVSHRKFSD
jgi:hypothetical protein